MNKKELVIKYLENFNVKWISNCYNFAIITYPGGYGYNRNSDKHPYEPVEHTIINIFSMKNNQVKSVYGRLTNKNRNVLFKEIHELLNQPIMSIDYVHKILIDRDQERKTQIIQEKIDFDKWEIETFGSKLQF